MLENSDCFCYLFHPSGETMQAQPGSPFPSLCGCKRTPLTISWQMPVGVVGNWKQWPWGHFLCLVPEEEKTVASMCYVAYYSYLYLNLFLSQAICCLSSGRVWSAGTDYMRKMPFERHNIFAWGMGRKGSNVALLDSPAFSHFCSAKAVCKAVWFEFLSISNRHQGVAWGLSVGV